MIYMIMYVRYQWRLNCFTYVYAYVLRLEKFIHFGVSIFVTDAYHVLSDL